MANPLVETKLYLPRPRRSLVARPRLSERLSQAADARLTLISAPAGFGKTTLLAAWLAAAAGENRSVAWLSLDEGDRRPATFWTYVITALQTAVPGIGAGVLPLLQSHQPPVEAVLAAVLNELAAVPNDVDLVLDDYHLVDGPEIRPGMAFLLTHLPPQIHLVISSRADPLLPLARLRARGELVEIRAADLRFTADGGRGLPQRRDRPRSRCRQTSPRWRAAPRAGSPRFSSPRSPCRAATTSAASSPASPVTTGTSSTTWSRRCCSGKPNGCRHSCCAPAFSTG